MHKTREAKPEVTAISNSLYAFLEEADDDDNGEDNDIAEDVLVEVFKQKYNDMVSQYNVEQHTSYRQAAEELVEAFAVRSNAAEEAACGQSAGKLI